jgi:cupin fold WbuC family metalloprotein
VKLLSRALLDELAAKAASSPRARAHHNIHAAASDVVQRFMVVALGHSYFRPHRHTTKSELATVVRGRVDILVFDEHGEVTARHAIGEGSDSIAYETPPNVWHTVVPGAGGGAFLEVKEGPYDPATAMEFAAWAPAEGDAGAAEFLRWLRRAQPGDVAPASPVQP